MCVEHWLIYQNRKMMQLTWYNAWQKECLLVSGASRCIYVGRQNRNCCFGTTTSAFTFHYNDVIMGAIASQVTSLMIVYSTVYSGADQRKHESSVALAFVRGIRRGPVNSPHKWPVTQKMFPFDDVITFPSWTLSRDKQYCFMYRGWSLSMCRLEHVNTKQL